MKIALVNYRYFISGGPERYLFNVKEVLAKHGHMVIPFSIKNSKNQISEYESEFLNTIDDQTYFVESKRTLSVVLKSFTRMFYSFEARNVFGRFLDKNKPDVVYIIHFHNKISPSIIDAAKKRHIPVVHRISDFQYMCPNALFYNERTGVCEDCLHGKKWSCVRNRCVMNSRVYSFLKLGAKMLHDAIGVAQKIDAFVVPASFTLEKLAEYGIPRDKMHHIPTFFNVKRAPENISYDPFFLFIGRIEKQKGLKTLVDAFAGTDFHLKIIGFSNDGYEDELKQYLKGKSHHIEFLGRKTFGEIERYLQTCLCTIVPSEWYDNFPNVILESFAYKKPVIATNFGSLPELVENGKTGLLFEKGSVTALQICLQWMATHIQNVSDMGTSAYQNVCTKYNAENHYNMLMKVFYSVQSGHHK